MARKKKTDGQNDLGKEGGKKIHAQTILSKTRPGDISQKEGGPLRGQK